MAKHIFFYSCIFARVMFVHVVQIRNKMFCTPTFAVPKIYPVKQTKR